VNHLTRWTICIAAAIAAMLWGSACNLHFDLDSVEPTVSADRDADAQQPLDASDASHVDTPDTPTSPDTPDEDSTPTPDSGGEDASNIESCTSDNDCTEDEDCNGEVCVPSTTCGGDPPAARNCTGNLGSVEGECDPLACDGCNADHTCMLRLRFDNGVPDAFVASCVEDTEIGDGMPDQSCESAGDCGPRTLCVTWDAPDPRSRVCSRLCDLESGHGCPSGYFCTNPLEDTLGGLGFCTRSCDPLQDACGGSEVCAYDPNYPDQTCLREFRCLRNGGFSGKGQGDPCDAAALHENGCPPGFLCVPGSTSTTCQKPCSSSNECDDPSTCQGAPGGLNTCQ
jgi:hypothetical protein